jgi:hypothetical protein
MQIGISAGLLYASLFVFCGIAVTQSEELSLLKWYTKFAQRDTKIFFIATQKRINRNYYIKKAARD